MHRHNLSWLRNLNIPFVNLPVHILEQICEKSAAKKMPTICKTSLQLLWGCYLANFTGVIYPSPRKQPFQKQFPETSWEQIWRKQTSRLRSIKRDYV